MSWSGSGTYNLPAAYTPETNGTTIDANRYNGATTDIAQGITACLAKNGENVPTANLPMGGFKHTGAANAASSGQYLVYGQTTATVVDLLTADGTAALPAHSFTAETSSGFYRIGTNQLAVAIGGTSAIYFGGAYAKTDFGCGVSPLAALHVLGRAAGTNAATQVSVEESTRVNRIEFSITPTAASISTAKKVLSFPTDGGASGFSWDNTNLLLGSATAGTNAANVIAMKTGVAPTTSPANVGQIYIESGALKYRGSSGTVTTIALA